jgi:hypothetical protein
VRWVRRSVYCTASLLVSSRRPTKFPVIYPDLRLDYKVATLPADFGDQAFHATTVLGAAIKALSKAWDFSVKQIVEASSFSTDNEPIIRVVGTVLDVVVTMPVDIIRKPNFKTA